MRQKIRKLDNARNIPNVSGNTVPIVGTIDLMAKIGASTKPVTLLNVYQLPNSVILGCDFCDRNLKEIEPYLCTVKMYNG